MRDAPVGNIVRIVKTVSAEDTIGKAAEMLRVSGMSRLPVVQDSRVIGEITEKAVLHALNSEEPMSVAERNAGDIMSDQVVYVGNFMTVGQVAEVMDERNLTVMPVIDAYGRYLGVVTASDITSALCQNIRPPVVAGMATPLGVYLTTGNLRAGAGDLGLMLSGVALMLMTIAATGAIFGAAWLVDKTGLIAPWSLWAILNSPPISLPNWMDTTRGIMLAATVPIFLMLLRLLPLSGYHAAEHQVVHAIENGEPLKPENVERMPRVHPRCGTNIIAGVMVFLLVAEMFSNEVAALVAIFVLVFAWRVIGAYFQYYVTTKPPNRKQLESGIKAGENLLELYRKNPGYRVNGWQRIWNTGMPQVMFGAAITMTIRELIVNGWIGLL